MLLRSGRVGKLLRLRRFELAVLIHAATCAASVLSMCCRIRCSLALISAIISRFACSTARRIWELLPPKLNVADMSNVTEI
jgi:hypothetical protein